MPAMQATPLPPDRARAFAEARDNGCVGTRLLSEHVRCRVWTIVPPPGARLGFDTHVPDSFRTAVTAGRVRSHHGRYGGDHDVGFRGRRRFYGGRGYGYRRGIGLGGLALGAGLGLAAGGLYGGYGGYDGDGRSCGCRS